MLSRKRAFIGVSLIVALAAIPAILKIDADRKLRSALTQIDSALTRPELERLIGRPPDLVLPSASDSPKGLDELFWARVIIKSQNEAELDAIRASSGDWCEKIPGAVLQGVYVHAYVRRDEQIIAVLGAPPRDLADTLKDLFELVPGPPPLRPTASTVVVNPGVEDEKPLNGQLIQIPAPIEMDRRKIKRLGELICSGNVRTCDNVILKLVNLYPGQALTAEDLRIASRTLTDSGIFKVDISCGIRPSVALLDPDSDKEFGDVLITVTER
jgi:hypothetical protein